MGVVYHRAALGGEKIDYGLITATVAVTITCTVLATIFLAARIFIRQSRGLMSLDDWMILASLVRPTFAVHSMSMSLRGT